MARIRCSDGLIHYEYNEAEPDLIPEGTTTVERCSHIDPVPNSSPPRFVIRWEPWLQELMGEETTTVDDDGKSFFSYSEAVAYERKLLNERYYAPRPV